MKKYIRPTVFVVELQAREKIAANPLDKAVVTGSGNDYTTTYDLALFGVNSKPKGV